MRKNRFILISLFVLMSAPLWAKDPIGWTLNQNFPNPITINTGSYSVQYTFKNQLPFTLVHPIKISKTASSSEFSFNDLCTGKKLAPNETCTVDVILTPSSIGLKTVSLTIECYDKNQVKLPALTTSTINNTAPAVYTVGGQTHGLTTGETLVIQNNGGDNLILTNDTPFTFSNPLPNGSTYEVTILTQPQNLTCSLSNSTGSGTINNANVTNVTITCSAITYSVGGTLVGYTFTDPVLIQNNNADNLFLSANGIFTFPTRIAQSSSYNVTVLTQPAGQLCTVENGSGTNVMADVTNVVIRCANQTFTIGGTVTGLVSPAQIRVQTNGVSAVIIGSSNGNNNFVLPAAFANGTAYNVVVLSQPGDLDCSVTNGSGIVSGASVTNVAINCVPKVNFTTLTISTTDLALSVTGRTEYGVGSPPPTASGAPRVLTITNTGAFTANNLIIETIGLPGSTTYPSTCGASLNAGANCTITVTPGADASTSDGTNSCNRGTAPTPGTIFVSGTNTGDTTGNSTGVSSNVTVIDYGCIYQNGYVFALDDRITTGNVKGKVAAAMSQSTQKIWSSNSSGTFDGGTEIYGTSEISTTVSPHPNNPPVLLACNGSTDGTCDTANIVAYYQAFASGSPINLSFYAAGLCKQTISGVSDWYLPAICELGYGTVIQPCGSQATPLLQNMQSNLVEFNSLALISGQYWSSTTHAGNTITQAWQETFGSGQMGFVFKGNALGVRCARIF